MSVGPSMLPCCSKPDLHCSAWKGRPSSAIMKLWALIHQKEMIASQDQSKDMMSQLCVSAWFPSKNIKRIVKASHEFSTIHLATFTTGFGMSRFTLEAVLGFTNLGSITKIDDLVSKKKRNLTIFPAPGQVNKNSMIVRSPQCGSGKKKFSEVR